VEDLCTDGHRCLLCIYFRTFAIHESKAGKCTNPNQKCPKLWDAAEAVLGKEDCAARYVTKAAHLRPASQAPSEGRKEWLQVKPNVSSRKKGDRKEKHKA
jgi:hypothetical protein